MQLSAKSHAKNVISTHKWECQLNHVPASFACKIPAAKFMAKVPTAVHSSSLIFYERDKGG